MAGSPFTTVLELSRGMASASTSVAPAAVHRYVTLRLPDDPVLATHNVFPFGKPLPTDPARPATTFKTVWGKVKAAVGVTGRWHDHRHTFITDLAESGDAGDETIRQLAGHVSRKMLEHYSHIRMAAKRRAVDALVAPKTGELEPVSVEPAKESAKVSRPS